MLTDCVNEKDIKKCVKKTFKKFGGVNILVNNAASFSNKLISSQEWKDSLNVKGYVKTIKHVVPYMVKNDLTDVVYENDQGKGKT